jgi:hypothetical protein
LIEQALHASIASCSVPQRWGSGPGIVPRRRSARFSTAVELVIDCGLDFAYRGRMDSPNPDRDTAAAAAAGAAVHPVLGFARAIQDALDGLAEARLWSMTSAEQQEALIALQRVETRVAELDLRVLAAAERNQVGAEAGATSTAAWLAQQTRQTRGRCAAAARLAAELDEDGFAGTGRHWPPGRSRWTTPGSSSTRSTR